MLKRLILIIACYFQAQLFACHLREIELATSQKLHHVTLLEQDTFTAREIKLGRNQINMTLPSNSAKALLLTLTHLRRTGLHEQHFVLHTQDDLLQICMRKATESRAPANSGPREESWFTYAPTRWHRPPAYDYPVRVYQNATYQEISLAGKNLQHIALLLQVQTREESTSKEQSNIIFNLK